MSRTETAKPPGFWPAGKLVNVDGHEGFTYSNVVELGEDAQLPDGTCFDIDPEVSS